MADKPEAKPERPSMKKTIIIVSSILVLEAAAVIGLMRVVAGPATVDASQVATEAELVGDDRIVETMVLHAKLPNSRTGITYLYDAEIYVQTRERHAGLIQRELDQFNNEIRADITAIWRTAEPHHFQEPNLESLTRHVFALLNERFGPDQATSEPIIHKCVIVMGTGFRIDN